MTKYVLHRSYTLSTTKGHRIRFEKDVPTAVPAACVADAVAIGAVPVDGAPVDVIDEVTLPVAPEDPFVREKNILGAIEKLVERNARADFNAANAPKHQAVSKVVGYTVEAAELKAVWQKYHELQAEKVAA